MDSWNGDVSWLKMSYRTRRFRTKKYFRAWRSRRARVRASNKRYGSTHKYGNYHMAHHGNKFQRWRRRKYY